MGISKVDVSVVSESRTVAMTQLEYYKIRELNVRRKNKEGVFNILTSGEEFDVRRESVLEVDAGVLTDEANPVWNDIYIRLEDPNINQANTLIKYTHGTREVEEATIDNKVFNQTIGTLLISITPELYDNANTPTDLNFYSADGLLIKTIPIIVNAPKILDAYILRRADLNKKYTGDVTINESEDWLLCVASSFELSDLYVSTLMDDKGLYSYTFTDAGVRIAGYNVFLLVPNPELLVVTTGDYVMDSPVVVDESYYEHSLGNWITKISVVDDRSAGFAMSIDLKGNPAMSVSDPAYPLTFTADGQDKFSTAVTLSVTVTSSNPLTLNPALCKVDGRAATSAVKINIPINAREFVTSFTPPSKAAILVPTAVTITAVSDTGITKQLTYTIMPNVTWDVRWPDATYDDPLLTFRNKVDPSTLLFKLTNWDFNLASIDVGVGAYGVSAGTVVYDPNIRLNLVATVFKTITSADEFTHPTSNVMASTALGLLQSGGRMNAAHDGNLVLTVRINDVTFSYWKHAKEVKISDEVKSSITFKVNGASSEYVAGTTVAMGVDDYFTLAVNDANINVMPNDYYCRLVFVAVVEHKKANGTYGTPFIVSATSTNGKVYTFPQSFTGSNYYIANSTFSSLSQGTVAYGSLSWYNEEGLAGARLRYYMLPLNYGVSSVTMDTTNLDYSAIQKFGVLLEEVPITYTVTDLPPVLNLVKFVGTESSNNNKWTSQDHFYTFHFQARAMKGASLETFISGCYDLSYKGYQNEAGAEAYLNHHRSGTISGVNQENIPITVSDTTMDAFGVLSYNFKATFSSLAKVSETHYSPFEAQTEEFIEQYIVCFARSKKGTAAAKWSTAEYPNYPNNRTTGRSAVFAGKVDSSSYGMTVGPAFYGTPPGTKFKVHRITCQHWLDYDINEFVMKYYNPTFTLGETVITLDENSWAPLFSPDVGKMKADNVQHRMTFIFSLEVEMIDDTYDYTTNSLNKQRTRIICEETNAADPPPAYPRLLIPVYEGTTSINVPTFDVNSSGLTTYISNRFAPTIGCFTQEQKYTSIGNGEYTFDIIFAVNETTVKLTDNLLVVASSPAVKITSGTIYPISSSATASVVVGDLKTWRRVRIQVTSMHVYAGTPAFQVFIERSGLLLKSFGTLAVRDRRKAPLPIYSLSNLSGAITGGGSILNASLYGATSKRYNCPPPAIWNDTVIGITYAQGTLYMPYNMSADGYTVLSRTETEAVFDENQGEISGQTLTRSQYVAGTVGVISPYPVNFATFYFKDHDYLTGTVTAYYVDYLNKRNFHYGTTYSARAKFRLNASEKTHDIKVRPSFSSQSVTIPITTFGLAGTSETIGSFGEVSGGLFMDKDTGWSTNAFYLDYYIPLSFMKEHPGGFIADATYEPIINRAHQLDPMDWTGTNTKLISTNATHAVVRCWGAAGDFDLSKAFIFQPADCQTSRYRVPLSTTEVGNCIYSVVKYKNASGSWVPLDINYVLKMTNTAITGTGLYNFQIAYRTTQNTSTTMTPAIEITNVRDGQVIPAYTNAAGTTALTIAAMSKDYSAPTNIWLKIPNTLCTMDIIKIRVYDTKSEAESIQFITLWNLLRAEV